MRKNRTEWNKIQFVVGNRTTTNMTFVGHMVFKRVVCIVYSDENVDLPCKSETVSELFVGTDAIINETFRLVRMKYEKLLALDPIN